MDPPSVAASVQLEIAALSHRYGGMRDWALRDIALTVRAGEILCLLGPSGCGKSSLLRLVAGLERVQRGGIRLGGTLVGGDGAHVPPEARGVGMVFQDFALFPHMNLLDNVAFGLRHLPRAQRLAQALEMLRGVGLEERVRDMPHRLSGGQQQRVALARALAPSPRMLLLDEPFSSLDARLRHRLRTEAMQLLKRSRISVVMVTHDPQEALFMADRIALMDRGRIVQAGKSGELYRRPANAFAAAFFGETSRMTGVVRQGRVWTVLGEVAAPGLNDGAAVEILLRPQAIELDEAGTPGTEVRVRAAHMLGSYTLVELDTAGDGQEAVSLQAHVSAERQLLPRQRLSARLRPEQGVFVFANAVV